jgi:hypothetical protein
MEGNYGINPSCSYLKARFETPLPFPLLFPLRQARESSQVDLSLLRLNDLYIWIIQYISKAPWLLSFPSFATIGVPVNSSEQD